MLIEVLPMVHHVLVMSVNPGFGGQKFLPRSIDRIAHLRRLREEMGLNFRIEVDGGVAHDTVASVVEAGADMLVAGSAIFEPGKTEKNAREFLRVARKAAGVEGTGTKAAGTVAAKGKKAPRSISRTRK
jgi:ribulose-phosphate 3-epimerase